MQSCLIVDPAPVIRKVASRILFQMGLSVEGVANSDEALRWIESNGMPEIAIVAASTEDSMSVDLVRQIREQANGRPIVILGAIVEANLGLMTRLRRAGATAYIYKPFDRQALEGWLTPFMQPAGATVSASAA
ncbi:response regulator [Aurantimonas sp. A2-1-M11]|uniref:response regulator n=1 Tax=Aurantimonas sp. A2-1-M11 TaxID=3113712 RepID=UPI002F93C780